MFRSAVRGRQAIVAEALRGVASVPVEVTEGRWVVARACGESGCPQLGIVLGWDAQMARLYLLVVQDGAPVLLIPPGTRWPAAFGPHVAELRGP